MLKKILFALPLLSCFLFLFFMLTPVHGQVCIDTDGDGFGLNGDASCPNPGVDCDDTDANVYPGALRICDAKDSDCDGFQDFFTDRDGDGDGVPLCANDCNDNDPNRYPGNQEGPFGNPTCSDAIDNDCDYKTDLADTQCQPGCTDNDTDGYGNPGSGDCPNGPLTDCNDSNPSINPGAADDNCNGVDDNCSGTADDEYVITVTNCGVGECARTGQRTCNGGVETDDCVAGMPVKEGPTGDATCTDGLDNDCDGLVDLLDPDPGCTVTCLDDDGDGYGFYGDASCPNAGVDCDDDTTGINPGATDANCDNVDDNCSGSPDDEYVPPTTNCGVGECTTTGQLLCAAGATADNCTPLASGTEGPFGDPSCVDGLDNDCDGQIDLIGPDLDCNPLDQDNDGDGFCEGPACTDGSTPGDCNDVDPLTYPGAARICDGRDNDCDTFQDFFTDKDEDGDGVPLCASDCDDNDPNRYPGNVEGPFGDPTCEDNIDNDCDFKIDLADNQCQNVCSDSDGDGYGSPGHSSCPNGTASDCNDTNASINPGASDSSCNGVDDNCSDTADDGYIPAGTNCGVGECASTGTLSCVAGSEVDNCIAGAPVTEGPLGDATCTDSLDNDCDGLTDGPDPGCQSACLDNDGDGYGANGDVSCPNGTAIDCDDSNDLINPGATDANCDNVDDNCSGTADDEYVSTTTNCGLGECATTGQLICIAGAVQNTCTPLTPFVESLAVAGTCSDTIDNDCDGLIDSLDLDCNPLDEDNDGDGFCEGPTCTDGSITGDCDDTDPLTYPGAVLLCDGKDNDCDTFRDFFTDVDGDGDGVPLCLGDCDDDDATRFPGNQEGPRDDPTCFDGIDNDCNSLIDAADAQCAPPTCTTRINPKDGPHMFDLLDQNDAVLKIPCQWCHFNDGGTVDQRMKCERCHADPAWGGPDDGTLKLLYPLDPPYGFGTATNVRLHSSTTLGIKYGSWDMTCVNCHNPHLEEQDALYGTNYGQYIKEYICLDNPVTGLNIEEIVEFTADTGAGSFADGPPHNENICEMCHTQTDHHRRDGLAPGDLDAGSNYIGHNDGKKCTKCHSHFSGFSPAGADLNRPHNTQFFFDNCQFCHVGPATDALDFAQKVPSEMCTQCHGERHEHTSDITRNPFASGKYNFDITCVDCHDPMFTVGINRKLLRPLNAFSIIPGSLIVNTTRTGPGSLADGPPHNENICETCHTLTDHHRYDGSTAAHNDGEYCMLCHDHNKGFMLPGPSAEE